MKKLLLTITAIAFITSASFAAKKTTDKSAETASTAAAAEKSSSEKTATESTATATKSTASSSQSAGSGLPMRVGVFFNYEPTAGALADYIYCNLGGGATFEMGLPIIKKFELGIVGHVIFNGNPVKSDLIDSVWNTKFMAGASIRFPIGNFGLIIQPEVCYGLSLFFPVVNSSYSNSLDSCYSDSIIQIGAGIRWQVPKILNGKLELNLTPTYTILPQRNEAGHFIGFRVGAFYKIR